MRLKVEKELVKPKRPVGHPTVPWSERQPRPSWLRVMELTRPGVNDQQIADELGLSVQTVRQHRHDYREFLKEREFMLEFGAQA